MKYFDDVKHIVLSKSVILPIERRLQRARGTYKILENLFPVRLTIPLPLTFKADPLVVDTREEVGRGARLVRRVGSPIRWVIGLESKT